MEKRYRTAFTGPNPGMATAPWKIDFFDIEAYLLVISSWEVLEEYLHPKSYYLQEE